MNYLSFLIDFSVTVLGFLFCCFAAVAIRYVFSFLKKYFSPAVKPSAPRKKPRRSPAVRSIEINPDEVDRIYVRKIS